MKKIICAICVLLSFSSFSHLIAKVHAGAANPNVSVLGQFIFQHTDDVSSEDTGLAVMNMGETELVFDAYLNPYAKGFFVFSVCHEGFHTEEAYLSIFKGLPNGLLIKGGKYLVGFGKLNTVHPHASSFIEKPRVLAAMLPGTEGFNEIGVHASYLFPSLRSWASNLSLDLIKGASFHPDETKSAAGWVGRWSNSFLANESVPLEAGVSLTQGVNNIFWNTKTEVYGADIKSKIPISNLTSLTLQGEYFYNSSDVVVDTTTGVSGQIERWGFYAFADLKFHQRWNGGAIYEQYQPRSGSAVTDRSIKCFLGYSLLEETTLFRLSYEEYLPEAEPVVKTYMFQVLFSMGPHKAHQF